jgi:hypothetical protein
MNYPKRIREELERLASFEHFQSLLRPKPAIFEAIGLYSQLAATIDLHLRRVYFALRAEGGVNERGPERATLDQLLERLPSAIATCQLDLYEKEELPKLVADIRRRLIPRNEIVHAACRWQPNGNLLIFAHANERQGRDIRTGDAIAYWVIPAGEFHELVEGLDEIAGYISQYTYTWLPRLRPWLKNYWNGELDEDGTRAEAFFTELRRRSRAH